MVTSIYQAGEMKLTEHSGTPDVRLAVQKALPGERIIGINEIGWTYAPDWQEATYRKLLQVRVITDRGNHDLLVDPNAPPIVSSLSKYAQPQFGNGRIFNGFWPASSHQALGDRVVVFATFRKREAT